MTANEAIKILEVAKAECEWNAPLDYQEAFDLAISALREQDLQPTCNNLATDAISRQAAIDAAKDWYDGLICGSFRGLEKRLKALPSAQSNNGYSDGFADGYKRGLTDAQPERKRGEWTDDNACPFCGFHPWYERDIHTLSFCPNCGAKMEGEQ